MKIETKLKRQFNKIQKDTGVKLPADYEYYCGLYKWPKGLRKILSKRFNSSCMLHDIHHVSGVIDFKKADLIFLQNAKEQAGKNLFWILTAYVFYGAVRILTKTKTIRNKK